MDKNLAYYNNTPHNTMRLFIPKNSIRRDSTAFGILDDMSIWAGADYENESHWGWEFTKEEYMHTHLHRIVERYNRGKI